jgi:hypothetical protein
MVKVAGFDRAVNDAAESGLSLSPAHHLTVTDGARVRIGSRLGDPVSGVLTHRLGAPSLKSPPTVCVLPRHGAS